MINGLDIYYSRNIEKGLQNVSTNKTQRADGLKPVNTNKKQHANGLPISKGGTCKFGRGLKILQ